MNSAIADEAQRKAAVSPYLQLTVLVFAAGVIYPLLYLRQNFEVSMLETFNITNSQLGECYSMLGVLFTLTYLPSGWLADRVSPRKLLSFSLAMTGLLGIWYWTIPSFGALQVIFAGWGVTTGLTFWAALIKETTLIAGENRQGRFFGVLEGGRGVVEATLASLAVAGFAWAVSNMDATTPQALRHVILMYVVVLLAMAPIVYLTISESDDSPRAEKEETGHGTFRNTMMLLGNEQIWLCAICIFAGYTLFYSTYSFAGFLQTEMSLSAVMVGWITVGRLWMRPIGGVLAGFIADRWHVERVLVVMLAGCSVSLVGMVMLPAGVSVAITLMVVLAAGLLTFAVRGIYWATLNDCDVPNHVKGLAIGIISLIGYSPEIVVPLANGYLVDGYPGRMGYVLFYGGVAIVGLLGAVAAFRLQVVSRRSKDEVQA